MATNPMVLQTSSSSVAMEEQARPGWQLAHLTAKPYSKHDVVWDDLTGHEVIVNGIQYAEGHIHPEGPNPDHLACWGIYVGSTYLDGARHPWEISPLQ